MTRFFYQCSVCAWWFCWFGRPIAPFRRYCRGCKTETPWEAVLAR